MQLIDRIDALLPQTQCTRCGYPTCRDYAVAIAGDAADIDRCPPGGGDGVVALAELLGRAPKALNADYGIEQPPIVAVIEEDICIGCAKCIQACPVDAIVGAAKRMHTIIAAECTGCELCLPPCPVDCIVLAPIAARPLARAQVLARAAHARRRYEARGARLAQTRGLPRNAEASAPAIATPTSTAGPDLDRIAEENSPSSDLDPTRPIARSAVLDAIARGKARRQALSKDRPPK
jgi:electron transport complex protein RnfB